MKTRVGKRTIAVSAVIATLLVSAVAFAMYLPDSSSASVDGFALQIVNSATTWTQTPGAIVGTSNQAAGIGVWGSSESGTGVRGSSSSGFGVYGTTAQGSMYSVGAVYGVNTSTGTGNNGGAGVLGISANGGGVIGTSTNNTGVVGKGITGVWAESTTSGSSGTGMYGYIGGSGVAVRGENVATSGAAYGVYGKTTSSSGYGVYGYSSTTNGYAGYFSGQVYVSGNFNVGGFKNFRIDHPLDPARKYLNHVAVESDAPVAQYSGNVTLDSAGDGWVTLPPYSSRSSPTCGTS